MLVFLSLSCKKHNSNIVSSGFHDSFCQLHFGLILHSSIMAILGALLVSKVQVSVPLQKTYS